MPTVLHRLESWSKSDPSAAAQRIKQGGEWKAISAAEYADRVLAVARYLESPEGGGVTAKDIVCIFSPNCPEWVYSDLGTLLLGAKSAGVYPNSLPKDVHYILGHTDAAVLCVKDKDFFQKLVAEKPLPASVRKVLCFSNETGFDPRVVAFSEVLQKGSALARSGKKFADYLHGIDAKGPAFMIYTSGTTGNPKGAVLSHDNLVFTSDTVAKYWKLPFGRGSMFSFLPLCHIAEKLQSIGVGLCQRYTVNFCTKFENVAKELPEIQPTLLLCVPRLWEKMMEGVLEKVNKGTGAKKKLALWALGVGERVAAAKYGRRSASLADRLALPIADKLVLSKIRAALGLGKAEALASGAAALPAHVSRWFRSLQLEILEDFGQTESTGVICMTEPGVESAGTVGKPVPGMEFKLAEDGEVMTRGRHVFLGYYKDDENTRATLSPDGWLHTGDLGEMTPEGLVRIRGRKKEIMKTSGGKMIAPLPIEEKIKVAPAVSQVCLVGDGRKFPSALITLSESKLAELGSRVDPKQPTVTDKAVLSEITAVLDQVNKSLAGFEQVKKFAVLSREFSIADGEMTPTLKMKRSVIERRYQPVIDQMYGE